MVDHYSMLLVSWWPNQKARDRHKVSEWKKERERKGEKRERDKRNNETGKIEKNDVQAQPKIQMKMLWQHEIYSFCLIFFFYSLSLLSLFCLSIVDVTVHQDSPVHCVNIIWMNVNRLHVCMAYVWTKRMASDAFVNQVCVILRSLFIYIRNLFWQIFFVCVCVLCMFISCSFRIRRTHRACVCVHDEFASSHFGRFIDKLFRISFRAISNSGVETSRKTICRKRQTFWQICRLTPVI